MSKVIKNAYLVSTNVSVGGIEEVITLIVNCDNSFTDKDIMFLDVLNTLCAGYHFLESNTQVESYSKFVRFSSHEQDILLWPSNNKPQRLSSDMLIAFAGIVPIVSLNELVEESLTSKVEDYFKLLSITTAKSYSHQLDKVAETLRPTR